MVDRHEDGRDVRRLLVVPLDDHPWKLVPTLAFVLTAAFAFNLWQQMQDLESTLDEERGRITDLEAERSAAEDELDTRRRELDELRGRLDASAEESEALAGRVGELEDALRASSPQVNVRQVALTGRGRAQRLGTPHLLNLTGGEHRVVIAVEVADPEPYDAYRLRIVSKRTGEVVFTTEELIKLDGRWLRVSLPTALLVDDVYEVRVDGLYGTDATAIDTAADELRVRR